MQQDHQSYTGIIAASISSIFLRSERRNGSSYPVSLLAVCAISTSFAAHGQSVSTAESLSIPEVTVTAERRATNIQKTPVAVSTVSAEELDLRGARRLADLNGLAPGVSTPTSSYNGTTAIFIRGIGASRPIGNPSVGLYLDDVYLPRTFGSGFYGSLPDIERVEILRGPQGTLYGQNTSAGAVKYISKLPGETREAWISGAVGNHGTLESRGYISTPITPGILAASVSFVHDERGGDVYNHTTQSSVGAARNSQLRAIVRYTPTSDFEAVLSADGMHFNQDFVISPDPRRVSGAGRDAYADIDPTQSYRGGGASLRLTKKINSELSLKSVTAYRKFSYLMPTDYDVTPARLNGFTQDLDQNQWSQEFQLAGDYGRFNFITGLSFFHEVFEVDRLSWSNNVYGTLRSKNTTDSVGLFGQGNYKITDKLNLTAGLRVNRDKKGMDASGTGATAPSNFSVSGLEETFNSATPKLSLDYQWTPTTMTYVSWSKGETAGGYNAAPGRASVAVVPVDPEKVTAYELGLKTTQLGGRLRTNIALFYNDYQDYQASITSPTIGGVVIPGSVIVNAGKAKTYGAEFDTLLRVTQRLDAQLSLTYLKTEFAEFLNPTGQAASDLTGQELPNAPRFSAGLGLNYKHPLSNGGVVRLNGTARYQTDAYSDISTYREFTKAPAQSFVDIGAAYTTPDGLWTAFATIKNLFDKQYTLPGVYRPDLPLYGVTYNKERQFLVGIRRDF